jgi:hypothetical protein
MPADVATEAVVVFTPTTALKDVREHSRRPLSHPATVGVPDLDRAERSQPHGGILRFSLPADFVVPCPMWEDKESQRLPRPSPDRLSGRPDEAGRPTPLAAV